MSNATTSPGDWLLPNRRVLLDETSWVVGGFDERGFLVLKLLRRGLGPSRREFTPAELAELLASMRLRPDVRVPRREC